jgi:anti-sigma regulatory factor (Ser/Thr protein kinase)
MARMKLACTELFANCACHARQASCASRIEVESFVYGNCVTIRIRHHGPKFDPLSVPPPVFDGSKEGGFGTYIVLRSADAAAYEREPDGTNVITVSFIRGFEEDTEC